MGLTKSQKKGLMPVVIAAMFFLTACVLQAVDECISDGAARKC